MNIQSADQAVASLQVRPAAAIRLRNRTLLGIGLATLLLPAACGGNSDASRSEEAANASSDAAPAAASDTGNNAAADAGAGVDLSKYVGKHPSDAVDGTRFLDEPAVKAAVAASVPDPAVRNFVFNYNGPDAPIVAKDGRILAWGCERHNCGYHNWSVAITPDGTNAQVCFYHDDDSPDGPATWYLPRGKTETRPGNCPSD